MPDRRDNVFSFPWLFFAIAFGWTWAFWVPMALEANGLIAISEPFSRALMNGTPAAWGPLIAALVVAIRTGGRQGVRRILVSMIVGVFWALWHAPLFFQPRAEIYYNQPFWGLLVSTMLLSVLLTWVYHNTGHSLFAAMLMHTSWNWSNYLFTGLQTDTGALAFLLLMVAAVVVIVIRFGGQRLSRQQ